VSDNYTPGGPIKPPTGMTPKTFVLTAYTCFALVVAFSLATLAPGVWRWCAVLPALVAIWLITKAVRDSREVLEGDASESRP